MALNKSKMTEYGIEANYWKITMLSIDTIRKEANFTLNLYLSPSAGNFVDSYIVTTALDHINQETMQKDTKRFDKYFGEGISNYSNIYAACYACAKETEEFFKDATDC